MKIFALILATLCTACSHREAFYRFHSMAESVWHKDSVIRFEVAVHDTVSLHDVFVELRNTEQYPYKNIWLFISVQKPSGEVRRDTLECQLADDFGKWYGKGLSLYEVSIPCGSDVVFPQSGSYIYTVTQAMRDDLLQGISDVGLKIEKINSSR